MCENCNRQYRTSYVSMMPTNLYGHNNNDDINNNHVVPAFICKGHKAKVRNDKSFVGWAFGKEKWEFLYVNDMADVCVFLMKQGVSEELFNTGTRRRCHRRELAQTVMSVAEFQGRVVFDSTKPEGTPRQMLDLGLLRKLGWRLDTALSFGIAMAYADFLTMVGLEPVAGLQPGSSVCVSR